MNEIREFLGSLSELTNSCPVVASFRPNKEPIEEATLLRIPLSPLTFCLRFSTNYRTFVFASHCVELILSKLKVFWFFNRLSSLWLRWLPGLSLCLVGCRRIVLGLKVEVDGFLLSSHQRRLLPEWCFWRRWRLDSRWFGGSYEGHSLKRTLVYCWVNGAI